MNKKSILLILLSTLALGANAQGKYTIKGNLQNAEGQKIYLYSGDMGNMDIDSTIIANGKFTLNGELDTPFKCGNLILGNPKDYLNAKSWQIALEPTTITITGDANKQDAVSIKGGKAQDDLNKMKEEMEPFQKPLTELNKQYYAQQTQAGRDSISALMEPYRKQYKDYTDKFMKTRTDSYFATLFLNMSKGNMTYEDVKAIWENYSPDVQKYGVCAQDIKSELEVLTKVRPGKPAPDFTAKDINGKPFTLSSLKGKVVIIDFWASWCVPCRKSNPHMRELYNKYHKKGLDMVYVSLGCSRQNFYYYFDSIDEAIKELVDVDIKDISDFQIKANALRAILTIIQKRKVFYSKMFDTAESENLICKLFLEKLVDLYDNLASYFVRGYSNECKAFTRPILIQFAMADIALISDWVKSGMKEPIDAVERKAITSNRDFFARTMEEYIDRYNAEHKK